MPRRKTMLDTYVIMNVADVIQAHIDASKQTSLTSYRKSVDGLLGVFKYRGAQPSAFSGLTEYTHSEILVEMAKVAWAPAD